jgi:hypothetical protein
MSESYGTYDQDFATADAALTLLVFDAQGQPLERIELTSRGLTIGSAESNNLVLEGTARFQMRLDYLDGHTTVTNLSARNPIFLDGDPLAPQTPVDLAPGVDLTIGDYILRVEMAGDPAEDDPFARPTIPLRQAQLVVLLDATYETLRLTGGQVQPVRVEIRNNGNADEQVLLNVEGMPAEWFTLPTTPLNVPAGSSVPLMVNVQVPAGPNGRAGEYRVTLRARTQQSSSEASTTAYWEVQPFSDSSYELSPRKRRIRGNAEALYSLNLSNTGNTTTYYTIRVGDNEPALDYALDQTNIILEPGATRKVQIKAILREQPTTKEQSYSFNVQVQPAGSQAWADTAQLQWVTSAGGWIVPTALVLLFLFLTGALLWALFGRNTANAVGTTVDAGATATALVGQFEVTAAQTAAAFASAVQDQLSEAQRQAREQGFNEGVASVENNGANNPAVITNPAQEAALAQNAAEIAALQTTIAQQQQAQAGLIATMLAGSNNGSSGGNTGSTSGNNSGSTGGNNSGSTGGNNSGSTGGTTGGNATTAPAPTSTVAPTATSTPAPTATPAPAARVEFVTDLSTAQVLAGQPLPPLIVRVLDSNGNVATNTTATLLLQARNTAGSTITFRGGATLTGTTGEFIFTGITFDTAGRDYRLIATATVQGRILPDATSSTFAILSNVANQIQFLSAPNTGQAFTPLAEAVTFRVNDTFGNAVNGTRDPVNVTLSIDRTNASTSGTGQIVGGSQTVPVDGSGLARFSGISIDNSGTYVLRAAIATATDRFAVSAPITLAASPVEALRIDSAPSTAIVGKPFSTDVRATVLDENNRAVRGYTGEIELLIEPRDGGSGSQLPAPLVALADANGVVTFSRNDPSLQLVVTSGVPYRLVVRVRGSDTIRAQRDLNVLSGDIAKLELLSQPPTSTRSGSGFSLQVRALDIANNLATSFTGTNARLTLRVLRNDSEINFPARNATATGGLVTFTDLGVAPNTFPLGTGYTLQIAPSSAQLSNVEPIFSDPFEVIASQIVFASPPPTNAVAGVPFAITLRAVGTDGSTIDTRYNRSVTLALADPLPAGCAGTELQGETTINFVAGVAQYQTNAAQPLRLNCAGTYNLRATSNSGVGSEADQTISTANTGTLGIVAAAAQELRFLTPNANATFTVGTIATGALIDVQLQARDQFNNIASFPAGAITLSIQAGPNTTGIGLPAAVLTYDPNGATVSNNVATLPLRINRAHPGYRLRASIDSTTISTAPSGDSNSFTVAAGALSSLSIITQPPATLEAAQAFVIALNGLDAAGNFITATPNVGLTLNTDGACSFNPVSPALQLGGTTTRAISGGQVSFAALNVNRSCLVPGAYRITASSGSVSTQTTAFTVEPGPLHQLQFNQQPPISVQAGAPFSVRLHGFDIAGNFTDDTSEVLLGLDLGDCPALTPATPDRVLSGTVNVPLTNGVAQFDGLSVNRSCEVADDASGYAIVAFNGDVEAMSEDFIVTRGPLATLEFTAQPSGVVVNTNFNVTVRGLDAQGNFADGTPNVTLSLQDTCALVPNSGDPRTVTSADGLTRTLNNGVRNFTNLRINRSCAQADTLRLRATAGVINTDSNFFLVADGGPVRLVFATTNLNGTAGQPLASVVVRGLNSEGEIVALPNGAEVTLNRTSGPEPDPAFPLTATVSPTGEATFGPWTINNAATFVFSASITNDPPIAAPNTPLTVIIVPAAPAVIAFTQQPGSDTTGDLFTRRITFTNQPIPVQPILSVRDAFDNPIPVSANVNVRLVVLNLFNIPVSNSPNTPLTSDGEVAFTDFAIPTAGTNHQILAEIVSNPSINAFSNRFAVDAALSNEQLRVFIIDPATGERIGTQYPAPSALNITDLDNPTIAGPAFPTFRVALFAIPDNLGENAPTSTSTEDRRRILSYAGQFELDVVSAPALNSPSNTFANVNNTVQNVGTNATYTRPAAEQPTGIVLTAQRGTAEFVNLCLSTRADNRFYGLRVRVLNPPAGDNVTLSSNAFRQFFRLTNACTP